MGLHRRVLNTSHTAGRIRVTLNKIPAARQRLGGFSGPLHVPYQLGWAGWLRLPDLQRCWLAGLAWHSKAKPPCLVRPLSSTPTQTQPLAFQSANLPITEPALHLKSPVSRFSRGFFSTSLCSSFPSVRAAGLALTLDTCNVTSVQAPSPMSRGFRTQLNMGSNFGSLEGSSRP